MWGCSLVRSLVLAGLWPAVGESECFLVLFWGCFQGKPKKRPAHTNEAGRHGALRGISAQCFGGLGARRVGSGAGCPGCGRGSWARVQGGSAACSANCDSKLVLVQLGVDFFDATPFFFWFKRKTNRQSTILGGPPKKERPICPNKSTWINLLSFPFRI